MTDKCHGASHHTRYDKLLSAGKDSTDEAVAKAAYAGWADGRSTANMAKAFTRIMQKPYSECDVVKLVEQVRDG